MAGRKPKKSLCRRRRPPSPTGCILLPSIFYAGCANKMPPPGEGPARLSALSVLVFGGPMTLGQLAAAEQVKPPTMSRIVTGLEESRLAERLTDSKDARRIRIRATPSGERLLHQGRRRRIEYLASHLDGLSRQDLATLDEAIKLLEGVLQDWPSEK